ncbi:MAG: nucleotidyltransferase domain-containing protein [Vicinamibacterales bacterium]
MEQRDLARLRELVAEAPSSVAAMYVFGSVARGNARPDSDMDLAALLREVPASTLESRLFEYQDELARLAGRVVQLTILNTAPADLWHRVLRDGFVLLDRDRASRIRFEVRARNLYFDLLPHLERYRARAIARTVRVT